MNNNTYKFLSKACIETYAKNLFKQTKSNSLSQAALETLAIIAYKQPITRVEIEEIRGVFKNLFKTYQKVKLELINVEGK